MIFTLVRVKRKGDLENNATVLHFHQEASAAEALWDAAEEWCEIQERPPGLPMSWAKNRNKNQARMN
jgi:hypothetical protein